ncbi:hypothetical protein [Noviherbaspirillum massiliense]|uniref:hypothetical protein n=1 Tax=Noviherbaspirillum massiliense TaxID=1465823 RepID=UPI0003042228|nr:hypothetical protein [Noviherbaspirillum massiliense]
MYMVYWTVVEHALKVAYSREFDTSDMVSAMKFMEELRTRQRQGEQICFVTMASENPNSVGPAGVADPDPGYNWKKRRR